MKKIIFALLFITSNLFAAGIVGPGANQSANTVLAGPTSGGAAQPTYRILVTADFPSNVINTAAIQAGAVDLLTKVVNTLPIANGGTGQATKVLGFNALSPTSAKGDIIVFDGTNNVNLTAGTNNFVLTADSTTGTGLKWAANGAGTAFSALTGGTNTTAAMLVGTGASLAPTGTGHITADQFVGSGSTTNAVDLATAEVAGILTNAKGGTGVDSSATGGANQIVKQTSVGGAFSVAVLSKTDCPATTAFTDSANTFTSIQSFNNYLSILSSTVTQLAADAIALDPGAGSYVRVSSNATWSIRGMANGVNGRLVHMCNIGTSPILITNQDAAATSANQIITPSGTTITLSPNYGATIIYDSTNSMWRLLTVFTTGGSPAFSAITAGTNTSALVVGTGGTLSTSGSGTITANAYSGTLGLANGGLGITSGTSGGVPYFNATNTIASSTLLAANQLMIGGGAGAAPATLGSLGTTTTVLHGNAGGAPTFGQIATGDIAAAAVDMASKMTGTMLAAQVPAFTGDVTTPGGSLATTIAANAVTNTKILNGTIAAAKLVGTDIATVGTITSGTWNGTTIAIANGGSGQTTALTAYNAFAPASAKGGVTVNNGTTWVNLPVGADTTVLTADASQASGVKWGAAGGATVIAPLVLSGASVALGTVVAATTSDVNADIIMGASGTTKTPVKIQTKATNTAVAFEIQKSDGTIQYQFDNTTNSRADVTEKVQTANQANIQMQSISENVTIAAAATSTSATNLLPANSYIVGVTCRVTTVIPTAATFNVGVTGQASLFASAASTVNGTTASSMKQTPPIAPFTNSSAQQILITPNLTPGAATGTLRITVFYFTLQEPQN